MWYRSSAPSGIAFVLLIISGLMVMPPVLICAHKLNYVVV